MELLEEIFKKYIEEKKAFLDNEWFTFKSWRKRFLPCNRASEVSRLIGAEAEFNKKWVNNIEDIINKQVNKKNSVKEAILLIDTHIKKQNSRSFFLVLLGVFLASVSAFFLSVVVGAFVVVVFSCLFIYERLIVNEIVTALEELKLMIDFHK